MTPVHEVHSSELRGYRKCRELWNWRYREGWEPIRKPAALEDGAVWHKALEVLYNPDTWQLPLAELHKRAYGALTQEANAQVKDYLRRAAKYGLDDEEAIECGERLNLLRSMLANLCRSLDREAFKPIMVEQEFTCPLLDEQGRQLRCYCSRCQAQIQTLTSEQLHELAKASQAEGAPRHALPVVFSCRIDAVFEDREGYHYVVDHKSAANLLKEDSVIPELEDQLPNYGWCLRQCGYPVIGLILNQFRKAFPKEPKKLERYQLGRAYSTNRLQLTDYYTARRTFMAYDPQAYQKGLYNDYLIWLQERGPDFFRSFQVFKTHEQLRTVGRNLLAQARELINEGPAVYPNATRMNCEKCVLQEPCFAKQGGHDFQGALEAGFIQSPPYWIQRREQVS